jgi:outer membrane receptor protein involved in Fe transport
MWSGAEFRMSMNPLVRKQVPALLVVSFSGQQASGDSPVAEDTNDDLPGIPHWSAALLLRAPLPLHSRFTWELTARANGTTRAAWGSNAEVPAYAVVNARLSYVLPIRGMRLELSAYGENLTDQRYTAWVQVNDPGHRYYNPAPARGFYIGAVLSFGRNAAKP